MNLETFLKISSDKLRQDFSAVKELFDNSTKILDSLTGYDFDERPVGKVAKAEYFEKKAEANCQIYAHTLQIDYDLVISLVFDYRETVRGLKEFYKF